MLLLGFLIGFACLPLNWIDQWADDQLITAFDQGLGWRIWLPIAAMPALCFLQRGVWRAGMGSGIAQVAPFDALRPLEPCQFLFVPPR